MAHTSREQRRLRRQALLAAVRFHGRLTRAESLSALLGVSLRTIYRDVSPLRRQNLIRGEAGAGYMPVWRKPSDRHSV
jgi:DeoR/GlpR family transcriptional regulator of sugar metabolism